MSPPISRPSSPPLPVHTPVDDPTNGTTNRPGTPPQRTEGTSTALVRHGSASSALPGGRRTAAAEASTAAANTSQAIVATRRRAAVSKLHGAQGEPTGPDLAEVQRILASTVGSLDPAAMQAYFDVNVPQLFGRQGSAQQRLNRLLAGHGIPGGEQMVDTAMRAIDRMMTAPLQGNGEGSSTALQPTLSRQEQAAFQGIFDAVAQIRGQSEATPPATGTESRIHELETDQDVATFLAGADGLHTDAASMEGLAPSTAGNSSALTRHGSSEAASRDGLDGLLKNVDVGAVTRFAKRVLENRRFESKAAQWGATTNNLIWRNLASVGATTVGRELFMYGLELGFERQGLSPQHLRAISAVAGPGYQALTHALGGFRDFAAGTATRESVSSRAISALTAIAAFMVEDSLGLSDKTAAVHVGMTAYTHARDVGVQSWLRLPARQDPPEDAFHFKFMSLTYGIDQMLTPMAMMLTAPLSGANAARAGATLKEAAGAALIRGGWNTLGEVAEDLLNEGNRAIRAGHAPEVSLAVDGNSRHFVNGWLGQQSVRSAIISEAQSFAAVIAFEMTRKNASPMATLMVTALMIGLVNGVQYWPFAKGFSGQPKVRADEELGMGLDDLSRPSSSSSPSSSASRRSERTAPDDLEIEELADDDPHLTSLTKATPSAIEEPDDTSTRRKA